MKKRRVGIQGEQLCPDTDFSESLASFIHMLGGVNAHRGRQSFFLDTNVWGKVADVGTGKSVGRQCQLSTEHPVPLELLMQLGTFKLCVFSPFK